MSILIMTIPVTVLLVTVFVLIFLAAVNSGQFDDLETPGHGLLLDDVEERSEERGDG